MIDPKDDCCGDADAGEESVCTSVVMGVDAVPIFGLAEHVLDFMWLTIEYPVMGERYLAVGL